MKRFTSLLLLATLAACATTGNTDTEQAKTESDKPKKQCQESYRTGSTLPQRVCR